MIAFFTGLIIGFLMCIPVGPINVCVINTQIKKSVTKALSIAFGGSLMDFVYFYFILSGLSFIDFKEKTIFYLKFIGILVIFILGLKEIISTTKNEELKNYRSTPQGILAGLILGIIIYTSNPTLIITMSGLGAFIKSLDFFQFTQTNILLVSTGLSLGSFLWFVFLVKIVNRYQETIRNKYLNYFTKISGALMVGLSLFMGHQLYS